MRLLSSSAKIEKSNNSQLGYYTKIQYFAPIALSGNHVCPFATKGCATSCLFTAGRGRMKKIQLARIQRTKLYFQDRDEYSFQLSKELTSLTKAAIKRKCKPVARLNGTSEIPFWKTIPNIIEEHSDIQFYDYVKNPKSMNDFLNGKLPSNYHLTFSRSENNEKECQQILNNKGSVAVVFRKELPKIFWNFKVIDGDKHDLRFLDQNCIIGLTAKGNAKKDDSGFVVD